jgi:hypothetical protein
MEVDHRIRVVAVCGGRDFNDMGAVFSTMDMLSANFGPIERLIHGDCPTGADAFADRWGNERGIRVDRYAADWKRFGKSAGPRRNSAMIAARPDAVVAFEGGDGTRDMVSKAEEARDKGELMMLVFHRKTVAESAEEAVTYDGEDAEAPKPRAVNGRGWYGKRLPELLGYTDSRLGRTIREIHAEVTDEFDSETGERVSDFGDRR